jgi:hypothetical protein
MDPVRTVAAMGTLHPSGIAGIPQAGETLLPLKTDVLHGCLWIPFFMLGMDDMWSGEDCQHFLET